MAGKSLKERTGARRRSEIPRKVLAALNRGELETVNLVEWLAVDHLVLLKNVLASLDGIKPAEIVPATGEFKKWGVTKKVRAVGLAFNRVIRRHPEGEKIAERISGHPSDTVRGWACYRAAADGLTLKERFRTAKRFAADPHFGVRELAWLAVRPFIKEGLAGSIKALESWAKDRDENIRRFASEATRPRGVWCPHIKELKENPGLALGILEPLKSDPSKYVRDSVGNWLNDAGKTRPEWTGLVCREWLEASPGAETEYIVKKALRNLR